MTTYQSIRNSYRREPLEMGTKFFVVVEGVETQAQRSLIRKVKRIGQTEVESSEDCDYLLVFCPIVSRVAADINGALARIPANKPAILVVLHHTNNKCLAIAESSRLVHDQNVELTVDFLFWDEELLNCNFNDESWAQIQNHLGSSNKWTDVFRISGESEWYKNPKILGLIITAAVVITIVVAIIVVFAPTKNP